MRKLVPYFIFAAAWILYFLPFFRLLPGNGDEGTLITGASRVAEGQLPFRDFFEVMGPGTFYWLAGFFKVCGEAWLTTRVCLLVTTLSITLLVLYLARRLNGSIGVATVIFFVAVSYHQWNAISHHMDSNLWGLLAFVGLVNWIDRRRSYWLFLAGAGAGLTTWFMLPKGVFLGLAFAILLWIFDRKESRFWSSLCKLAGGYLLVMAAGLSWFWLAGGLSHLIYANLIWPLTQYGDVNVVPYGLEFRELYWKAFTTAFGAVLSPWAAISISSFLSVPLVILMGLPVVLLAFALRYRGRAFERVTLPYWVAGVAFWLSEMHRKDVAHMAYGSPLLIILAFYFVSRLQSKWFRNAQQLIMAAAVTLAMLNPLVSLAASHKVVTRRGTFYSSHPDNPVLDFIDAHVAPGGQVFIYPYAPQFYFLSAVKNPTRYSIFMGGYNTEAQFQELVQSLEQKKVRYVVWDRSFPIWVKTWFPAYRPLPPGKEIVATYLTEHYRVIGGSDSDFQFLERKESTTSSAIPVQP
jgi:hypothetical protein